MEKKSNGKSQPHAQGIDFEKQDFDHFIKGSQKVIKLSFRTLYIAMRMSNSRFEELMERYGYIIYKEWHKATSSKGRVFSFHLVRPTAFD
jgi:hypothetical protein